MGSQNDDWKDEIFWYIQTLKESGVSISTVDPGTDILCLHKNPEFNCRLVAGFNEKGFLECFGYIEKTDGLWKHALIIEPGFEKTRVHLGPHWGWFEDGKYSYYAHGFEEGSPVVKEQTFVEHIRFCIDKIVSASGQDKTRLIT